MHRTWKGLDMERPIYDFGRSCVYPWLSGKNGMKSNSEAVGCSRQRCTEWRLEIWRGDAFVEAFGRPKMVITSA